MGRRVQSEEMVGGKRKKWLPMQLKSLGKATDLIKGGGGKLSVAAAIRAKAKSRRAADPFAGESHQTR